MNDILDLIRERVSTLPSADALVQLVGLIIDLEDLESKLDGGQDCDGQDCEGEDS